jgi:lysophospholipase
VVALLRLYSKLFFKTKSIAPNQKHFNPNTPIETSSAKSKPRFEYQLDLRRKDDHYQACAATFGWALASIKVHSDIMKNAGKVTLPIVMMTAGEDHLIDPEGYSEITKLLPHIKTHHYASSRHEIFNADEETRKQYFTDVLTELSAFTTM